MRSCGRFFVNRSGIRRPRKELTQRVAGVLEVYEGPRYDGSVRLGSPSVALLVLTTVLSGAAHGETVRARLAVGGIDTGRAPATTGESEVHLDLHKLPGFLEAGASTRPALDVAPLLPAAPEWFRLKLALRERPAIRYEGPAPTIGNQATLDEVTRQLEQLDMVGITGIVPILEPVRVLSSIVVAQANQLIARGMSVEVSDRVDTRYTPLRGLAGDIQRGQYLRTDDVTGRQFNFDVRLVLAWRPNSTVRFEAGYAIAYLTGTDSAAVGPIGGERSTNYFLHGPCAALNLDF